MNANQIINMVMRLVMRRLVGRGINAGISAASKRMGKSKTDDPQAQARNAQQGAETSKRARQAARVTRRLGRF
ncbi:hypothetical protein [Anianabacter salinae]|uniref:hypothetical protein n=1 Tax=Anianabacter salinae TaxID=2851023 RepID=UPI00225E45A9|nr:hypothetical protein [Anianabacter salinae]MBV0911900.1 hypothetical protein [Anianabacter salinae]